MPDAVLAAALDILPVGTEFGSFTRKEQAIPFKTPSQGTASLTETETVPSETGQLF